MEPPNFVLSFSVLFYHSVSTPNFVLSFSVLSTAGALSQAVTPISISTGPPVHWSDNSRKIVGSNGSSISEDAEIAPTNGNARGSSSAVTQLSEIAAGYPAASVSTDDEDVDAKDDSDADEAETASGRRHSIIYSVRSPGGQVNSILPGSSNLLNVKFIANGVGIMNGSNGASFTMKSNGSAPLESANLTSKLLPPLLETPQEGTYMKERDR